MSVFLEVEGGSLSLVGVKLNIGFEPRRLFEFQYAMNFRDDETKLFVQFEIFYVSDVFGFVV